MTAYGAGIISIPVEQIAEFVHKLRVFYETNDMQDIKNFI